MKVSRLPKKARGVIRGVQRVESRVLEPRKRGAFSSARGWREAARWTREAPARLLQQPARFRCLPLVALACSLSACGGSDPLDVRAIGERLEGFDSSGEFTRVNAAPLASQHLADSVNIWVSGEGLDTYLGVDPDDETDTVDAYPDATMIVKEQLDESGARSMLTVMAKGAEGGAAETAGWWWGRYSADGVLIEGGAVGFCIDCHRDNGLERTDWTHGVSFDDR